MVADAVGGDGFVPVTATRGQGITLAALAVPPPEIVGVHTPHPNVFEALGDASSVNGDSLTKDADGVDVPIVHDSLQAIIDASFEAFFGPDSTTAPTPRRLKGLFDDGAQVVDWLVSEIRGDHEKHVARLDNQVSDLKESAQFNRGALRADIALLWKETEDALGPTVWDLSRLAAMACQTALDVQSLIAASEETTNAMHVLRQEMAGCTALKAVVDDLKTCQLNNIRENVKRVEATCSTAVSD